MATISSVVTTSSRSIGTLNKRKTIFVKPLNKKTTGVNKKVTHSIGVTIFIATASGIIIATRLGNRSANKINNDVIQRKEKTKLIWSNKGPA